MSRLIPQVQAEAWMEERANETCFFLSFCTCYLFIGRHDTLCENFGSQREGTE